MTDVLIINMWETSVGLYNGANMGLLKTVFEVNLQLFAKRNGPKTLLFFVIRDFIGSTPIESLSATIQTDLQTIWGSLSKPKELVDCKISDFFTFQFSTLPHKILKPEEFDVQSNELRKRFYEQDSKYYVFKETSTKTVPADGLCTYASNIWNLILENKDLDLPTQQELLAQFRCDEIASTVFEYFKTQIVSYEKLDEMILDFGSRFEELREVHMELFNDEAHRYSRDIYTKKKEELFLKINERIKVIFQAHMAIFSKKALKQLGKDIGPTFIESLKQSKDEILQNFDQELKVSTLSQVDWDIDIMRNEFIEQLEERMSAIRTEKMKDIVSESVIQCEESVVEQVQSVLTSCPNDMWVRVMHCFKTGVSVSIEALESKMNSFGVSSEESKLYKSKLVKDLCRLFIAKLKEELSGPMIIVKARQKFEEKFRYDDQGIPRIWKPTDDIEVFYIRAKDHALTLLGLVKNIPLDAIEGPEILLNEMKSDSKRLEIMTTSKLEIAEAQIRKEMEVLYIDAKRSMVASSTSIPLWVFVLILILGWNELVAVLSNPFYLLLTMLIGIITYLVYALNLWPVLSAMLFSKLK